MSSPNLAALLAAVLSCATSPCLAVSAAGDAHPAVATPRSELSTARLGRLHAFMREATDARGYLGGVTLVARHGRIVDWQAYGHRDLGRREPMRRDDIFRIYSMTKTIASVAVLMLVEEGRINIDDPVGKYLPAFADAKVFAGGSADAPQLRAAASPITIHHLLTHTAGFAAGLAGDAQALALLERADPHAAPDLEGFVARLATVPLAADPGTRFGYDGAALELSARLVEVVAGQPYERFLQSRILEPLGMVDTGFRVPEAKRDRVADITAMGPDGKLVIADGPSAMRPGEPLNRYPSAAGGLYSTAGDYARFAQMLLDGGTLEGTTILGRKTVDFMMGNHLTMLDPPVTQFNPAEGFGLGGYVVLDVARRGVPGSRGQFGWPGAASTTYFVDREEDLIAILMLQHLPNPRRSDDLPRLSRPFQALVYQALLP